MEFLRRLQQQLRQIWQGLNRTRRILLVVLIVLLAALIGGVAYWANTPEYRVLYSGLAPEDAAAVTSRLTALTIPYRLSANGTTISINAEQLPQTRIDLAAEGLPSKGTGKGFELFDESSPLGMTPFLQHVNYLRAQQAELARTIQHLEPISQARVHIVQPEPSPFIRDQKPPTASVVITLKPAYTLSRSMAKGIVALVARSVEGLTQENVTLLDNVGHILSDAHAGDGQVPGSQLEYRHDIENSLAYKAEQMLAQLLGPGRAIVRITADVNFRQVSETRETYSPDDKVVTAETVTSVKTTGAAPGPRGIAGATSNATVRGAVAPAAGTEGKGATSSEDTTDTKYAVSKTVQKIEDAVGSVQRLTVAAMIDLSGPADSGQGTPVMTLKEAEEIIKRAVGFKTGRDDIQVADVKLASASQLTEAQAEYEQAQRWQYYINLVRNSSLGVAALVALVLGILLLRRLRPEPALTPAAAAPAPSERTRRIEELAREAQLDPERVARVLEAWLGTPRPAPRERAAA
jgi:flagellar M-ring protein FliF